MAYGGPAEILKLVQAERPMLAIDEDEIEVELPQNVDPPWGWEGKVVAVSLASGTHGGFDSVGLLHSMSSGVRGLRSDRRILSVFDPLVAAELCTGRSVSSKMRCKAPNWQRPLCAESGPRSRVRFSIRITAQPLTPRPAKKRVEGSAHRGMIGCKRTARRGPQVIPKRESTVTALKRELA